MITKKGTVTIHPEGEIVFEGFTFDIRGRGGEVGIEALEYVKNIIDNELRKRRSFGEEPSRIILTTRPGV